MFDFYTWTEKCSRVFLFFPFGADLLNPGQEDPLEEGLATHSSIFAWRIPMDCGGWQATVHGVAKESDTTEVT